MARVPAPSEPHPAFTVVSATAFHRLTEREFGMPGLVAIESVGPFVDMVTVGPFITIHDSYMAPSLGIGHHGHRGNERLFYMLSGEIQHDDARNKIQGGMAEGDLARLTEGERGMLHQEWNARDDITTHVFILVYTPDADPPISRASFDALRAPDVPVAGEAPGVTTRHVIGGSSEYRVNLSTLSMFWDSTLEPGASFEPTLPADHGLIVYPIDGAVDFDGGDGTPYRLDSVSSVHPEGPDAMAIVWTGEDDRAIGLHAVGDVPARVLRIAWRRDGDDLTVSSD